MRIRPGRVVVFVVASAVLASAATKALPPVAAPPENPPSEAKRVLGKMLFWDEQLSSDDTMSCGSCHVPDKGGADPRRGVHPGPDGVFGTADDVIGSPAMVRQDAAGNFVPHALFGLKPQVTGRAAPSFLTGALADSLFWDGRAKTTFVDPQTGATSVAAGGALESQAVGPVLSSTEMGREGRTWDEVVAKLATRAPLALSSDIPPDVAAAMTDATRYPELFAAAFGDEKITAERIAFAIATYERTLVPDQTPWDRFNAGDASALTAAQQRGWTEFQARHCADCHVPPEFTDRSFRNIGLRASSDDLGRENVTKDAADRGKFKVPSLRSAALHPTHMHTGQFATIPDVLRFYARAPGVVQFTADQDPIVAQIVLPPTVAGDVQDFVEHGLVDSRSAAEQFPFDYPTTYFEDRVNGPDVAGAGRAGTAGLAPEIVAPQPPFLGNADFHVGVQHGRAGARAVLVASSSAPVGEAIAPETIVATTTLNDAGYATIAWPLPDDRSRDGEKTWLQWRVADDAAAGGFALSSVASMTLFAVKTTAAATPVVVDGSSLFVASASFTIDARRGAGSLVVEGVMKPTSVAGSTFVLSLGGVELLRATLDAHGKASPQQNSVRVDPTSGRFVATARGVDLRAATALDSTAGRGEIRRDVVVSLGDATSTASVPFRWTTDASGATRGAYRYVRDGLSSGAFLATRALLRVRGDGSRTLRVDGYLDSAGTGSFAPTGATLHVGATTLDLTNVTLQGSLVRVASAGAPYSATFTWNAKTRVFTLTCDGLPDVLGADPSAVAADLAVSLDATTSSRENVFETVVGLRRASPTSSTWRR